MHGMPPPDRTRWLCDDTLIGSGSLQREVFDRLELNGLDDCFRVSGWAGLATPQLHILLGVVEQLFAAKLAALEVDNPGTCRRVQASGTAIAVLRLAGHPAADEALLKRIETFVDSSDREVLKHQILPAAVAETRNRLSAFGGVPAGVVSASYAQLVYLAESGALGTWRLSSIAVTNPLFDTEIAVKILTAKMEQPRDVPDVLHDWAPDLVSAVRILLSERGTSEGVLSVPDGVLDRHIRVASTDELLAALGCVADDPVWGRRVVCRIAETADRDMCTDEVVGRFGWFLDEVGHVDSLPLSVLTTEFLHRRFGDHVPTWQMFASIADPSTPLAEAAALAVHAEPPPNP